MYFVYIIQSINSNYRYTGISDSVERRVDQHNKGYNKTTKPYAPFRLLLIEQYTDRKSARKREKYFKSGIGREYVNHL